MEQQIGTYWRIAYDEVGFAFNHPRLTATPLAGSPDGIAITLSANSVSGAISETRTSNNGESVSFDLFAFAAQIMASVDDINAFATPSGEAGQMRNRAKQVAVIEIDTDDVTEQIEVGFVWGYALPSPYGDGTAEDRHLTLYADKPATIDFAFNAEDTAELNVTHGGETTTLQVTSQKFCLNSRCDLAAIIAAVGAEAGDTLSLAATPVGYGDAAGEQVVEVYLDECAPDVYVRWLDSFGRTNFAGLSVHRETEGVTFATLYDNPGNGEKYITEGAEQWLQGRSERSATHTLTQQCYVRGVDADHLKELRTLLASTAVDLYLGGNRWQRIAVAGGNVTYPNNNRRQDFTVTLELPANIIQER